VPGCVYLSTPGVEVGYGSGRLVMVVQFKSKEKRRVCNQLYLVTLLKLMIGEMCKTRGKPPELHVLVMKAELSDIKILHSRKIGINAFLHNRRLVCQVLYLCFIPTSQVSSTKALRSICAIAVMGGNLSSFSLPFGTGSKGLPELF
jgi:hypothetical protein